MYEEKHEFLGDLFAVDLYLLCLILIFETFEIWDCLISWPIPKKLLHHFY